MTKISLWVLAALLLQVSLCSILLRTGIGNAPALHGAVINDIIGVFATHGVSFVALGIIAFACGARYFEVRLLIENNALSNRKTWHGNRLHATITTGTP